MELDVGGVSDNEASDVLPRKVLSAHRDKKTCPSKWRGHLDNIVARVILKELPIINSLSKKFLFRDQLEYLS
jgi:hypothetical protein